MSAQPELTEKQIAAIESGAAAGGKFIDVAMNRKSDMGEWSIGEWMTFIEMVCLAYETKLREIGDNDIPF